MYIFFEKLLIFEHKCVKILVKDLILSLETNITQKRRIIMGQNRQKINKNDFLQLVSNRTGKEVAVVKEVYDAIVEQMKESVCAGCDVSLTGFGSFALKKHKGHPVQFEAKSDIVSDYYVLKFTVSDVLMSRIRSDHTVVDAVER